ncbi:MAG: heat-inducible transcription repressor HrcA [Chitinivibrionales bacterium]|nr:heat-inducible transcription repressor HrcA [Chitinivibrionales bacterium]
MRKGLEEISAPCFCQAMEKTPQLTKRETTILEAIVRNYIVHGTPAGSRFLSKNTDLGLSSASIRNVMGDLEEQGFLTHPHTSAGRLPTDKGYRYYVDQIMQLINLPANVRTQIKRSLKQCDPTDMHLLLEAASHALSKASRQLGVVLAPRLEQGLFRHVHIFQMASNRYLFNLTIDSGFVKTMVAEIQTEISAERLERACNVMNKLFDGKALNELNRDSCQLYTGVEKYDMGVIRLFIPSLKKMAASPRKEEVYADGETNIMLKPEFADPAQMSSIVEILEEKKLLVHMLEVNDVSENKVIISIGGENSDGQLQSFSIVKTKYRIGNLNGALGILGPKRMPYGYLVSAVDYTARVLDEMYRM